MYRRCYRSRRKELKRRFELDIDSDSEYISESEAEKGEFR